MGGFKQVFAGFFYDILNIPMLLVRALRHWDAPWAVKPGWVHRDPGDEMLFVLFHGTNQSELLFRFAIAHFQQAVPPRCSYGWNEKFGFLHSLEITETGFSMK